MKLGEKESRALRPDAQAFDEVKIVTVPRFKQSELSGNEWRISAKVQFFRKGRLMYETDFCDCTSATQLLYSAWVEASEKGNAYFAGEGIQCDQEGCSEKAVWKATIRDNYCVGGGNCGSKLEKFRDRYRLFCERHKVRGDCDLEDCDSNYNMEKIKE